MASLGSGECRINITADEEISCNESENRGILRKVWVNISNVLMGWCRNIMSVGREDPRRITHAIKVGLALSSVSLLFLWDRLFRRVGFGSHAIWAVMTVVLVLEFSAGATMKKGLNRGIGTMVAAFLAFLVCRVSEKVVQGKAFVVGSSLFIVGAVATYARFFPSVKTKCDYGVLIFLLTFSMITVSGYRVESVSRMAYERFATILIGCGACLVASLLIFPTWAGQDLHNSTVTKLQGLGKSLQGCVDEYLSGCRTDEKVEDESDDIMYQGYKFVLDSKAIDDSLEAFANWEPRHGRFGCRHPWKQYVKIGVKLRYLAYSIVALHGCLRSEIETPHSLRSVLKKPCTNVAHKAAKLLAELSSSIEQMRRCGCEATMKEVQLALEDLQVSLNSQPKLLLHSTARTRRRMPSEKIVVESENREEEVGWATRRRSWHGESSDEKRLMLRHGVEFGEALPLATFAWLLVEIVARLEHVVDAVEELATLAEFKPHNPSTSDQEALIITSYTQRPSFAGTRERRVHINNTD